MKCLLHIQYGKNILSFFPPWMGWSQYFDLSWDYTSAEAVREEAGLEPMETYIWRRQNTDAQYIVTRPIMDLCEVA